MDGAEKVGFQLLSLRQLHFANGSQGDFSAVRGEEFAAF
jgi:hypothetical protein